MTHPITVKRQAAGLSQGELASRVGVSRQTINAIERDKHLPSLAHAMKIARILGSTVQEIFEERKMTDYRHRQFVDLHGQPIEVDETLSLEKAIADLKVAYKNSEEAYELPTEEQLKFDRILRVAQENAAAAFYRASGGNWPTILQAMGVN